MAHKARSGTGRTPATFDRDPSVRVGECVTCGKRIYLSRKTARVAAKHMTDGDRPRAYRCPDQRRHWHLGHLPQAVRHGLIDRAEYLRCIKSPGRAIP